MSSQFNLGQLTGLFQVSAVLYYQASFLDDAVYYKLLEILPRRLLFSEEAQHLCNEKL